MNTITEISRQSDFVQALAELDSLAPPGVTLEHYTPVIGTEIHGIDLSQPLAPDLVEFLRKVWLARKAIFFRDQDISREDHVRLGRYFGELQVPYSMTESENPELFVFDRHDLDPADGNNYWHVDTQMSRRPTMGAIAILREAPTIGGDTLFANMAAAYEGLPEQVKSALADLRVVHSHMGIENFFANTDRKTLTDVVNNIYPDVTMPLIQTHPETGEKIIYACRLTSIRIVGIRPEEGQPLLTYLFDQAAKPEYQCRFRWQKNSIACWENRAVQHYACADYFGQRRRLERVSVLQDGDWPDVEILE